MSQQVPWYCLNCKHSALLYRTCANAAGRLTRTGYPSRSTFIPKAHNRQGSYAAGWITTIMQSTPATASMSYASGVKGPHSSCVAGAITELMPHSGWLYSSKRGKVRSLNHLTYSLLKLIARALALGMVLFHATFMSLKACCPLTVITDPDEYKLAGEERLFKGYVSSSEISSCGT